jgi:GT2 family glycosyltransferase
MSYIHEVEGDKDIIVVIPTADFNGKYARTCREEIFKGLHMVFVESGENPDPYFNYAHNCNVGIKRAMEYNPKWVVVSNDDMKKVSRIDNLRDELSKLDESDLIVYAAQGAGLHSKKIRVGYRTIAGKLISLRKKYDRSILRLEKSLSHKFGRILRISVEIFPFKFFISKKYVFILPASFCIFTSKYVEYLRLNVFDETFINGLEDVDMSLHLSKIGKPIQYVDFYIDEVGGGTLGKWGSCRYFRDFVNHIYFTLKYLDSEGMNYD